MAGTISSAGIGSGLDVSGIIDKLMATEQAPLTKLKTDATVMQTKLSAFGQMQSLLSGFRDSLSPLFSADNYSLTSAASNDAASVAVTSTAKAAAGNYAVSVTTLAAAQTTVSTAGQFTDSASVAGTGSLTIRLGSWDAGMTTFTPKTGSSDIVVPIGASESTLAGIRDKINAANAGVRASIITDASGARLSLQSTTTGAENGFRITAADDDGNHTDAAGLSRLAFDPAGGATQMSRTQAAANTAATINGIAVTSTSTTLTDVVEGMTFTLNKVTTSPVTVTVSRNTDALKGMVNNMIKAFNQLNGFLEEATKYDSSSKSAGLLQGDRTAVGLQNQLRAQIGASGASSSVFGTLSSIGVEFQKDGSLKLNDAKFAKAQENPAELQKALGAWTPSNAATNGFAKKLATWADGMLGTQGTLTSKQNSIKSQITNNQKDQVKVNERLVAIEKRLRAQYSALDSTMSQANALQSYVQQQITSWNNIKINA
jgi:flagellar hook-associated protein 2